MTKYTIEKYTEKEVYNIKDIFNYYITNSYAAYPEELFTKEFVQEILNSDLPKYVVKLETEMIGFGFAYRYHPSKVFNRVTRFSYFIRPEFTKMGIGKLLLNKLESECKRLSIETVLVHISSLNEPSIKFHEKNGFKECGRFVKVGKKFGKDFDDIWMQKMIFK